MSKKVNDYEEIGKLVVAIHDSGYLDHKEAYKMSFIKGVLGGLGGVLGATLLVALLVWLLSIVSDVPLVERVVDPIHKTIQKSQK